jgi:hypothetical protein
LWKIKKQLSMRERREDEIFIIRKSEFITMCMLPYIQK